MRGYFGIGIEQVSKEGNLGNLVRSSHAFGASFFFTVQPEIDVAAIRVSDTSGAFDHVPYYQYDTPSKLALPMECTLVGVELTPDAVDLPSFRHPTRAAYILGPEMGHLAEEIQAQCDHIIKIPMKFCVNVGVAGALVMYDRMLSMGRFAERPVKPGGPLHPKAAHKPGLRKRTHSRSASKQA